MKLYSAGLLACSVLIASSGIAGAQSANSGATPVIYQKDTKSVAAEAAVNWTPVEMRATTTPQIFQGSDNKWNLCYELLLTNYLKTPAVINQLDVLDADSGKVIYKLTPADIGKKLTTPDKQEATELAGAGNGKVFINLSFDSKDQAPKKLIHKIVVASPDMEGNAAIFTNEAAALEVDTKPVTVIGAPFKGGRWVVGGGYAGILGHRKALFPLSNTNLCAQRYAIDWVKYDDTNMAYKGDKTKNESYLGYGEPVLAVADGTVVGVIDRFENQVPDKAVGHDRIMFPSGNTVVLDIGNGRHAMYAHLKPHSIKVKRGDKVTRGQEIAQLGNSGNTTAAHLHLHISDGPGILDSNGVPYYFDKFTVLGACPDMNTFEQHDGIVAPAIVKDSPYNGPHTNQLMTEGQIVQFPN